MVIRINIEKNLGKVLMLHSISLILLVSAFWLNLDLFIYGAISFLIISILLLPKDKSLLLLMMAVSIADMVTLSNNYTTSVFGIILVVYVLKNVNNIHIQSNTFLLYCIFALYMIVGMRIGQESLLSDIQTIVNYFVLYLVVTQFEISKVNLYFKAFISGHLLATVASLLIISTYRYSMIVGDDSVQLINFSSERFTGMQLDPNFYALYCVTIIAILLYTIANEYYSTNTRKAMLLLILYLILGIVSLSKMFVVAVLSIVLYFYISKSDIAIWKKIISIIVFLGLCILINLYLRGELFEFIFGRFINLDRFYRSTINALTTGRYQIWMAYIDDWKSSLEKILFGVGLAHKKLPYIGKMHHQMYIELLYQFGIVGTSIFLMYLYSVYKQLKFKVESSKDLLYGKRIGAIGIITILLCGGVLGMFALNITVYLIVFSFSIMAISKKRNNTEEVNKNV